MRRPAPSPRSARMRGEVADVALDHVEIRQVGEAFVKEPGEIGVAFEDDDAAVRPRLVGEDAA